MDNQKRTNWMEWAYKVGVFLLLIVSSVKIDRMQFQANQNSNIIQAMKAHMELQDSVTSDISAKLDTLDAIHPWKKFKSIRK